MGTRRTLPRRRIRMFSYLLIAQKAITNTAQIPCQNSSLGWNFKEDTYKGLNQFTLQMEYSYEDDS